MEIFHRLKLYADDDPTGQTRTPVTSVSGAVGVWSLLLVPVVGGGVCDASS
jgi:hypothetical protein